MDNAAASAGAAGSLRDYGPDGAADAAVDSAGAAVPFEELRAGRIRRRAMLEHTAASGRLDHATFRERADASVQCTGLGVKLYMPRSDEARAGYLSLLMRRCF